MERRGSRSHGLLGAVSVLALASLAGAADASETRTYTYDAQGRLVAVDVSGGPANGAETDYTYDPAGNRTNVTTTGAAPLPTFSNVGNASGTEGTAIGINVWLSAASSSTITVDYYTQDSTATTADYVSATGTLVYAPGETLKTVNLSTIDDTEVEDTERFFLRITNAVGATITDSLGQAIIADND